MRDYSGLYETCRLCPKNCRVDRLNGQTGFCGMPAGAVAASAVLHKGEEPPLTGPAGSGAVFFSGCTLGCGFCQNIQISGENMGAVLDSSVLADVFIRLQQRGAANINLVTATQFVPSILEAAEIAKAGGLEIPFTWNSSGFETVKTVKLLSGTVDIWLPDLKTLDPAVSRRLFGFKGYPAAAEKAVKAMAGLVKKKGGMLIEDGVMKRGLILRHLVMPGELESSRAVLKWFSENLKDEAMLSLMVQYTPVDPAGDSFAGPDYVMPDHQYEQLTDWLDEYGIEEGFLQAPEAASREWIPDFSRTNPFPAEYSVPVWHWRQGFTGA